MIRKSTMLAVMLTIVGLISGEDKPSNTPPMLSIPFDAEKARSLQNVWARLLGRQPEVTNILRMKLVLIPGGHFIMGPNGSTYRVTLSKAYYLGVTEVTLGQYRQFKPGHRIDKAEDECNTDDRPAALVSWKEAKAFCDWLSDQPEEKLAGRVYYLPTEAQWEWAARAGTKTIRHFGDTDKGQEEYSWFNVTYTPNPQHETKGRGRQPVGKLKPNAFGLYDTLGNVWEWCADRRVDPATGETRDPVMRGGSWRSGAFHCTSAAHDPGDPNFKGDNVGFRVACGVPNLTDPTCSFPRKPLSRPRPRSILDKKPKWRNGRRAGLKIRSTQVGVGSSPTFGIQVRTRTCGKSRESFFCCLAP